MLSYQMLLNTGPLILTKRREAQTSRAFSVILQQDKNIDFVFTASGSTVKTCWKLKPGFDRGNGSSEVPFIIIFLWENSDLFIAYAYLFQDRLFCVSFSLKWHDLNCYVRFVLFSKCQRIVFFSFRNNKSRGLWLCCPALSLFSFDRLYFWAQFSLSLFALPSYATCHCWDYCCAYLVRCWILFMTLSCVPTVKRLIKHLYLPQIQHMYALFFFMCL